MRYVSPKIPDSRRTGFHPDFAPITPLHQKFPGYLGKFALENIHAGTKFFGQTHACRGMALKDGAAILTDNLLPRPFRDLFTGMIKKYHFTVYVLYHNPFTSAVQGLNQNLICRI